MSRILVTTIALFLALGITSLSLAAPAVPPGVVDLDVHLDGGVPCENCGPQFPGEQFDSLDNFGTTPIWTWQVAPEGIIYRSYLAGAKEPRLGAQWFSDTEDGSYWDSILGGRVGLVRFGNNDPLRPQGWQLDFEGAAFLRQDMNKGLDVVSVDFRAGVPLTYASGKYHGKFGYYHLSSHLGDELLLSPSPPVRINFLRDALVWGHGYHVTDALRVYAETGYAFNHDGGSEQWEFQFGFDYSPIDTRTLDNFYNCRGTPFFALNVHLREELDFGGNIVVQTGWQWRNQHNGHVIRAGLHYYNGKSPQYEFFNTFEHQIGGGLWYDF